MSTLPLTLPTTLFSKCGLIVMPTLMLPSVFALFEAFTSALLLAPVSAQFKTSTILFKKTALFEKFLPSLSQATTPFSQSGLLVISGPLPAPIFIPSWAAALILSLDCGPWFKSAPFPESCLYVS